MTLTCDGQAEICDGLTRSVQCPKRYRRSSRRSSKHLATAKALAEAGNYPLASCLEALDACGGIVAEAAKLLVARVGLPSEKVGLPSCRSIGALWCSTPACLAQAAAVPHAAAPAPGPPSAGEGLLVEDSDDGDGDGDEGDSEHDDFKPRPAVAPRARRDAASPVESSAVLSAVRVGELIRRAEELSEATGAAAADEGDPATVAVSPAVTAAARGFTSVLLAARSALAASVAGTQTFASVPLEAATEAAQALARLVVAGQQLRPGALLVPLPGEGGAVKAARTSLDAALATLLLAATPGIDARVVSEDALAGVLALLRFHLVSHILPAFDPLDDLWARIMGGGPAAPPKKGKKAAVAADADGVGYADDLMGAEPAPDAAASKVTKAVLASAQVRVRPVIVAVCEVFTQLTAVLAAVKVADSLVRPLEEVCLLAATQTDASSAHAGSSSAKASAAAAALAEGTAASSPEAGLQVAAMSCLQRVFLRLPAHPTHLRAALLSELATTHIRSTGGRRFRRAFIVPVSIPRPHLQPRGSEDSGPARSLTHVTACSALLCLLLQVR